MPNSTRSDMFTTLLKPSNLLQPSPAFSSLLQSSPVFSSLLQSSLADGRDMQGVQEGNRRTEYPTTARVLITIVSCIIFGIASLHKVCIIYVAQSQQLEPGSYVRVF